MNSFRTISIFLFCILNQLYASTTLPIDLQKGDQLYEQRAELSNAYQALALYKKQLDSSPLSSDALWRASMANYYVGHLIESKQRRIDHYRNGIAQGKLCASVTKNEKVECLFWLATNTALLKKENGIFSMAMGISGIIKLFEKALRVDSSYAGSGPFRMLALLYYKAPGFLGGDSDKAYSHIKKAIEQTSNEPLNHYFYIKFLKEDGNEDQAMKVAKNFLAIVEPNNFTFFESKSAFQKIQNFIKTKSFVK